MRHLMRAVTTASFILQWFATAMADGKITPIEMAEFVTEIARIWKIRVTLDTSMLIDDNVMSEMVEEVPGDGISLALGQFED